MKTIISLILAIFISLSCFAQKNAEPTEEDINIANALKEQFPDDHVAIEYSKENISFGLNHKTNKVTVNQVLKEGLINIDSRADIQKYSFYDGESKITEFSIKYRTKKDANFRVRDEAYTSNDLFHNDTRVKFVNLDFPLKGYKYLTSITKEYQDIKYFTSLYFNNEYPIKKKVIEIELPDWLDIEMKEINFEGFNINKEISNNSKTGTKTYTYTVEDIPSFAKENNAPGPTYIYPHILVLAKSFTANGSKEMIFSSTQDLYNWYKSLVVSLKNDEKPYNELVVELTKDATTDEEKIKNIYYWVQDNIRYIAFEDGIAGFKPDEAANVYTKRYGDCKGMANLTKQMLTEAGYDARLTWIGTKRIAYDYTTPNLSVNNHMICTVILDGETIFLDGTEKFNAYGEYAHRIQGKQVLIEDGQNFILKEVPVTDKSFNKESIVYSLILSDEELVGEASKNFNGQSRTSLLYYFNTLKNDKKEEFLEWYLNNGDSNIKVSDIETSDLLNRELSLDISYDITIKNAVSSFDDDYYIDIDFDKELAHLDLKKRKTNYLFSFKKDIESITDLKIPDGFSVTHLPENLSVSNDNYDLSITFSHKDNSIIYEKQFSLKKAEIDTTNFEEWNDIITKLNGIYNDQIIISKQ